MIIPLIEREQTPHQVLPPGVDAATLPHAPQMHLFETEHGSHLLVVNGSRLYSIGADVRAALERSLAADDSGAVDAALVRLGLDTPPAITDEPLAPPPVRAISLAISQKCNLGCTYCYAQEGGFGGAPRQMPLETALAAVELLVSQAAPGERVNLAFLGGEPLANRAALRAATEHALALAAQRRVQVTFSITTNGTLLTPEDGAFFEQHGFAVTVSLDGVGDQHDQQRAFKGGQGSYAKIIARVAPLLAAQWRMQVSARVTVTPRNMRLRETLDAFIGMGFHSVGFSPMLSSPTGRDQLDWPGLAHMLEQMIACGHELERRVEAGQRYPFLNMVNALRELHRGTHRPYPCGAGAGYLGVSAEGDLAACHRFVGDEAGALGSLSGGVDNARRAEWLAERHVHRQEPCRSCWARYLCGGGCHHEVIQRGRPACHYIRGWLHYCLQAYMRLSERCPWYMGAV